MLKILPMVGKTAILMKSDVKESIINKAKELGFDDIGFAKSELSLKEYQKLESYQKQAFAKEMPWLVDDITKRSNPKALWNEAKTAICLLININPTLEQIELAKDKDIASIAFHAQGDDYHKIIKKKLVKLGKFIKQEFKAEFRALVDTAPLMEKPLAERAGLGWQGRHSLLVSNKYGSFVLLGELLLDVELEADEPNKNHCGNCERCLKACPTGAISKDGKIDIIKCLAYQLIENKEEIPENLALKAKNKIYGCDDCALACPFNKPAYKTSILNPQMFKLKLEDLAQFDEVKFNELFQGTGIKRIGFTKFKKNVLTALRNRN